MYASNDIPWDRILCFLLYAPRQGLGRRWVLLTMLVVVPGQSLTYFVPLRYAAII